MKYGNTINGHIITMKTKYGKSIPLTNDIPIIVTMETKYGKRIPLTNDIPKLLQWKQNMERECH